MDSPVEELGDISKNNNMKIEFKWNLILGKIVKTWFIWFFTKLTHVNILPFFIWIHHKNYLIKYNK